MRVEKILLDVGGIDMSGAGGRIELAKQLNFEFMRLQIHDVWRGARTIVNSWSGIMENAAAAHDTSLDAGPHSEMSNLIAMKVLD